MVRLCWDVSLPSRGSVTDAWPSPLKVISSAVPSEMLPGSISSNVISLSEISSTSALCAATFIGSAPSMKTFSNPVFVSSMTGVPNMLATPALKPILRPLLSRSNVTVNSAVFEKTSCTAFPVSSIRGVGS